MIIDCRSGEFARNPIRAHVFVDGKEVREVFYVDTDQGFVRTYDVLEGKGAVASRGLTLEERDRGECEGWDMPATGVVSKMLHGSIELRPIESLCS